MDNEHQSGEQAVELTPEQQQALWNEVRAEREAVADGGPAPDAAPAAEPPAAAEPAKRAPSVEELQAEIAQMKANMERQTRNSAGMVGGLKQQMKALEQQLAEERERAAQRANAPTQQQVADAAGSGAKWEQLKADYPEWAEAIEERFGTSGARGDEEAIRRVEQRAAQEIAAARADAEAMRRDVVESIHPGWEALCKTDEFRNWMRHAGEEELRLARSDRPSDAVKLLNRFKYGADVAPGQQLPPGRTAADLARSRQQRLSTAVTPPRGTAGSASAKSPQDMTDAEYWEYLKLQRTRQQGAR